MIFLKTNKMALVSVIITTFNRKKLLDRCLRSILNQTFSDFEVIVIDNFSNYDFFNFVRSFNDTRIRPFQNKNNGIISVNRNFGIKKSSGEYVAFCDDDDVWLKKKLEIQLNIFSSTNYNVVCSSINSYIDEQRKVPRITSKLLSFFLNLNLIHSKYILIFFNYVATSSVIAKKEIFKKLNFDENKDFIAIEDYDLWFRISLEMPIYYTKKRLINYYIHKSQSSNIYKTNIKSKKVFFKNESKINKIQKLLFLIK